MFVGFRPPCWCSSRCAPAWRPMHTNLFKFGSGGLGKTFLQISRIRNIPLTWILARVFVYVPPFISQIPDFIYWMVLIFILIYFEWRDTESMGHPSLLATTIHTRQIHKPRGSCFFWPLSILFTTYWIKTKTTKQHSGLGIRLSCAILPAGVILSPEQACHLHLDYSLHWLFRLST